MTFCRIEKLTQLGFFQDRDAAMGYIDQLETLHQDPSRTDIAWQLGIDEDLMDERVRLTEVRNWVDKLVLPKMEGGR